MINQDINKYVMRYDYHTHTVYSHGKGQIIDNARVAVSKGLEAIAITDHGPGHKIYGINPKKIPQMREDIRKAKLEYPKLQIYLGVEANFIDTPSALDVLKKDVDKYDFIIAGYHYGVLKGHMTANLICSNGIYPSGSREHLRKINTEMTVRALHENDIKIITHPGDKGPFDIRTISKACEETNTLMEINTKHDHLTVDEIKIAETYDVKFIIDSDAHLTERVGDYKSGLDKAAAAGLDFSRIVNISVKED